MRLFQRDAYIGIDFLEKKTEVIKMKEAGMASGMMDFPIELGNGEKKIISVQLPEVAPSNAIKTELTEFVEAIAHNTPTRVSVHDGYQAMDVAHQIIRKMSQHSELHHA